LTIDVLRREGDVMVRREFGAYVSWAVVVYGIMVQIVFLGL